MNITLSVLASPIPIQFSIPTKKVIDTIPEKDTDFAFIIPGVLSTYIYHDEQSYYKGYQRAYYAITCLKGGWDCLRHYEILANGCIPYFVDLDKCPENTMKFLPKQLIWEAMHLRGVSYNSIDWEIFDKERYYEILKELLWYTKKHLTTQARAQYLLDAIGYNDNGKILYLSNDLWPDYLRCLSLIGLKELLGVNVVDCPKIEHIYTSFDQSAISLLYGRGMTYTRIIDDYALDREHIEQRIKNKEFSKIIYGSIHRGLPFHDLVLSQYDQKDIAYLCGEDAHSCPFTHMSNLFLREFPD